MDALLLIVTIIIGTALVLRLSRGLFRLFCSLFGLFLIGYVIYIWFGVTTGNLVAIGKAGVSEVFHYTFRMDSVSEMVHDIVYWFKIHLS